MEDFASWLEKELENRDWKPADLSRRSGIGSGLISRILNRERRAGPDSCVAIARALQLPPETVFRAAGLLPPVARETEVLRRLVYLAAQLPSEDQDRVLAIVETFYEQAEREDRLQPLRP